MQATWWTRFGIVLAVLAWGVWSLLPTFLGEETQSILDSQASSANVYNQNQSSTEPTGEDETLDVTPLGEVSDQILHAHGVMASFDEHTFDQDDAVVSQASSGTDSDIFSVETTLVGDLHITLKWLDWLSEERITAAWTPRDTDYEVGADGVRRVKPSRLQRIEAPEGQEDRYLTDRVVYGVKVTDAATGAVLWEGNSERTFGEMDVSVPVATGGEYHVEITGQNIYGEDVQRQDRRYQLAIQLTEREVELPWWATLMPESRISLGLDLQGGIDFTLEVKVMEAVNSAIARDVRPIVDEAAEADLSLVSVLRRPNEDDEEPDDLWILPEENVTQLQVQDFMTDNHDIYFFAGESDESYQERTGWLVFTIEEEQVEYIQGRAMEQALETLRSRIDETGVKEPSITQKGDAKINVQLPGMDNVEDAMAAIGTAAVLEFIPVDEDAMQDQSVVDRALRVIEADETKMGLLEPERIDELNQELRHMEAISTTSRFMWEHQEGQAPVVGSRFYILEDRVILTGDDVNDASVQWDQFNTPYVALEFKAQGGRIFAEYTGMHVGDRFAIVLDGSVRSAPVIRERIGGGRASIEMGSGDNLIARQEASVLALVLRTGALPAPVSVNHVRTVGATLGADAIAAGKKATVVGFFLVLVFMLLYYKKAGAVSVVALVCNLMLVMALLSTVGATLTLPGIAGIALTVGMAVDCNIIIFERIREEKALGKNARAATDAGFGKAFLAVIDANITTFIAGVVLYTYGTGPIKGFAVTLMIGILTTLFTGIFLSRTLMDWMTRKTSARLSI